MPKLRRPTLMLAIAASLSLGLAACDREPAAPAATPAADSAATPPAAPKPQLGSFGFDATGMDRSVAAGDDFFG
ncbi:MAG: M13 family peptidase, partial [Stenotrophomonas sp.]